MTESILGTSLIPANWTGIGIPIGVAGTYITVDGISNVSGGLSAGLSALFGDNRGDTYNFMKNTYIAISPENGKNIYNATQIGIGFYCITKGLINLPEDCVSVYARSQNIRRVNIEGLATKTVCIEIGNQVVLTTKTESGLYL